MSADRTAHDSPPPVMRWLVGPNSFVEVAFSAHPSRRNVEMLQRYVALWMGTIEEDEKAAAEEQIEGDW